PAGRHITLRLLPFMALRDFHGTRRAAGSQFEGRLDGRTLTVRCGDLATSIASDTGQAVPAADWWYDHHYAIEAERGQDHLEDLYNPGAFVLEADSPATITLWAGLEQDPIRDWEAELDRRRRSRWQTAPGASTTITRLTRAAQDFVVRRHSPDKQTLGTTIIAGYPWFADWGRDTMISLPGLLLATKRFEEARQVLAVFA